MPTTTTLSSQFTHLVCTGLRRGVSQLPNCQSTTLIWKQRPTSALLLPKRQWVLKLPSFWFFLFLKWYKFNKIYETGNQGSTFSTGSSAKLTCKYSDLKLLEIVYFSVLIHFFCVFSPSCRNFRRLGQKCWHQVHDNARAETGHVRHRQRVRLFPSGRSPRICGHWDNSWCYCLFESH